MKVKDMKPRHWLIMIVVLALLVWSFIWLSGPLTVDDVSVPDVDYLVPGFEK